MAKSKKKLTGLALDIGSFSKLLQGKPLRKPFGEIEELAGYIDALVTFVRTEYSNGDGDDEQGFVGFINEQIVVRISKQSAEVVSRNRFGSSTLEVLIPYKANETIDEQEMRKLFYHTQFRKTMKASQADLAHSFYSMLEPRGVATLLTRYGKAHSKKSKRK